MEEGWSYNQSIQLLQQQLERCLIQEYQVAQGNRSLVTSTDGNCLWITRNSENNESEDEKSEIDWLLGVDSVYPVEEFVRRGVVEYWLLDTQQVELTVYRSPTEAGYQKQRCFYVGDHVSPLNFPSLMLEIQEPLPLRFLTRTAIGVKVNVIPQLPLKLVA